jgi:hypothetical protein
VNPPVRAGREPDDMAALRWRKLQPIRFGARPASQPPGVDGRRRHMLRHSRSPCRGCETSRTRRFWRDRAGEALTESHSTSDVSLWSLGTCRSTPCREDRFRSVRARFRVHARLGSPHDQVRRHGSSVRRARTYEPRRLPSYSRIHALLFGGNPSHRICTRHAFDCEPRLRA